MRRKRRKGEAPIEEPERNSEEARFDSADLEEAGPDSAGQSGDTQGLSRLEDVDEESVEELAETDQPYEAEVVEGVEDAGDHPERPARTHEKQ